MKKLVTAKTIEDFAANHGTVFQIGDDTLITPSARDAARTLNIKLVHEDEMAECCCCECTPANGESESSSSCSCTPEKAEVDIDLDKELIVAEIIKVLKEKGLLDKMAN